MIRITEPYITQREKDYVNEALTDRAIGAGRFQGLFEGAWARYNHYNHAVACSSGTAALFLALKALGTGPGDEVIVPEFTMIACAWAVTYTGAKPVFVDCDETLAMDRVELQEKRSPNVKAIMGVAIYGRPVPDYVFGIAADWGVPVVEDLAEGHGIQPKGEIACYSFYGNKILTTGEGGMCLTQNQLLAEEIRKYSNLYFDKERTMIHQKIGYNYRMSNLQAAVGLAQVENVQEILAARQQVIAWYDQYINPKYKMPQRAVGWVYDIRTDEPRRIKDRLLKHEIESRYWFRPMSEQPMYLDQWVTKMVAYRQQGIYLPLYPTLSEAKVRFICETIN